jgi:hypothetical protein
MSWAAETRTEGLPAPPGLTSRPAQLDGTTRVRPRRRRFNPIEDRLEERDRIDTRSRYASEATGEQVPLGHDEDSRVVDATCHDP